MCNYTIVWSTTDTDLYWVHGKNGTGDELVGTAQNQENIWVQVSRNESNLSIFNFTCSASPEILIVGCSITNNTDLLADFCLEYNNTSPFNASYTEVIHVRNSADLPCVSPQKSATCVGNIHWWDMNTLTTTPKPISTSAQIQTTEPGNLNKEYNYIVDFIFYDNYIRNIQINASINVTNEPKCDYSFDLFNNEYDDNYLLYWNHGGDWQDGTAMDQENIWLEVRRNTSTLTISNFTCSAIPQIVTVGCSLTNNTDFLEGRCLEYNSTSPFDGYTNVINARKTIDSSCSSPNKSAKCVGSMHWWDMAPTPTSSPLQDLANQGVGLNNVTQVLNTTLGYSQMASNLSSNDIMDITTILKNSASLQGITAENSVQILSNIDSVMNAGEDQLKNSTNNLLNIFGTMVHNTNDTKVEYLKGQNLGFSSKKIDCSNLSTDDGLIDMGNVFETINSTSHIESTKNSGVIVPLSDLCQNTQLTHIFFTIYRDRKLFSPRRPHRTYGNQDDIQPVQDLDENALSKCSPQISVTADVPVVTATILNDRVEVSRIARDGIMANVQFNIENIPNPLHGKFQVTWWNTSSNQWASDQYCTITQRTDKLILAQCPHLTDFTVIVDGSLNDQIVCDEALSITGYIVNSFSVLSLLFLTTISILVFVPSEAVRNVLVIIRGEKRSGDLLFVTYYASLLLFYLMFLSFVHDNDYSTTGCVVIAVFMYFFILSAIMLNIIQGIRIIHTFLPFKIYKFFSIMVSPPAALTISFGIPAILCTLLATLNTSFFVRNDSFCWIRPDYIINGIIVPVSILLLNTAICTSFAAYKMFFFSNRCSDQVEHFDGEFWSKIVYIVLTELFLGAPWTNVYNLSPLHFSMFANDENCGILSRVCTFNLQKGETLQIKIVKIDQATKLLTFLYIDQNQEPQINAGKCPVTFPGLDPVRNCVAAEEIHSDTIGNSYLGDFCICGAPSADCSPTIANDSCISNQPWWHQDNPSSSTSTTPTTIVTTSRPSTTTKPSLTTESTSTSTSRSTPRSTSTSTSRSTPSSTSTTSQTSTSTTSMTSPTTSTLSSTTKISTTVTTTQSTPLPTTTQTTSTNFPPSPTSTPTLKNLSDSGVGINNVSTILNETLVYSKMGPNLNSTQVFEISTILYNSCNVPGLTVNNSLQILQNLDNILNVNEETFYQSGTSSSQLLSMLPSMVHNTENHRIDYLEGLNLGFTAKKVDCTNLDHDDGILDLGTRFELLNSSSKISETHQNSIVIPLSDLCGTQDLTHVFFTIYRQKSLFVGQQQYNIYNGKSTPLGKQTMILNGKNGMGNRVRRDAENQTQTPAPSACSRQTSLINSPVLSATILNNGVTLKTTTSQATMAVLKFNTTGIQKPLHGQLKVTWWDTGRQLWATDRQCTIISDENGIVTANCLHLTDFAIIVDAALNDPNVCDTALIDLGYVVNGFSIVALIFLSVYSIST
ncbi:unnamed protein product [Caenorhabditis angaria]|uniref:GPS domain-containing protein n=1 Tax=Caenorhabditis angaria TaxID=860376 RepID=A0A9P1IA54_9PELO|nr:unnamed protein product [Caenorhabditis angaria]